MSDDLFRVNSDYYHKPAVWAVTSLTRTGATVKSDQTTSLTSTDTARWTNYLSERKEEREARWISNFSNLTEEVLDQTRENRRVAAIFQRNAIRLQRYKEYVPINTMAELERIKGSETGETEPGQEVGYTHIRI